MPPRGANGDVDALATHYVEFELYLHLGVSASFIVSRKRSIWNQNVKLRVVRVRSRY
jgi:hypothetical protein